MSNKLHKKLSIDWIVGFTDGEGCFNLDVHAKKDMRWGLQMQPEFIVVQHSRDEEVLEALIQVFGCGSVGVNRSDSTSTRLHFRVKSVEFLYKKVLPFFDANPLITKKQNDYLIFREIVIRMYERRHLKSLKDFLDVIDLGVELSKRGKTAPKEKKPGKKDKRDKVNAIVMELRAQLAENPDLC